MHKWPSYKPWRRQERQRRWTAALLGLVEHLPNWDIGSLEVLKFHAKRRHEQSENMRVHCPEGISIRPAFITYYDLYFTEDFQALQNGLVAFLRSGVVAQPVMLSPQKELPKLFENWRTRPGGGAWHRIGHLTFKQYPMKPTNFEALSIDLIQISPTCVNLVVSAFPSDLFKTHFREIITKDVKDTMIIPLSGIFRRHFRATGLLPSKIRQNELEELFLEMNHEVVRLLREFIGRGWAAKGPMPSVECLAYENDPSVNPEDRTFNEFWRSLSLTRIPSLYYKNDSGVSVVPPDWLDRPVFTSPYRVLVDTKKFLVEERTRGYASHEIALFYNLEKFFIHPMAPVLALREHSHRAVNATAAFRDKLSPTLASKHHFLQTARTAAQLMYIPPRLNSLYFAHARVTDSTIQRCLARAGTDEFHRETQTQEDDRSLVADLRREIDFLLKHIKEQLTLMRSAYQDLWSFSIQWILIILSLIALFIAVVQLIPNKQGAEIRQIIKTAEQPAQPDR